MTPCPRCGRENPSTAASCAGCRTPLAFDDAPARARLDADLDLDRRRRGREPLAAPIPDLEVAPDAGAPAFEPLLSDWEMGAPHVDVEAPPPAVDGRDEAPDGALRPAPPLRRAAAWAVDGGLLAGAAATLSAALLASTGAFERAGSVAGAYAAGLPLVLPSFGFVAVAGFVYATVAHTLAGATLGKRLAGLRVVGADGRPPGPACSAARSAWLVLSVALAGAGLLPALVSPSGRTLHDRLAGTRVVDAP